MFCYIFVGVSFTEFVHLGTQIEVQFSIIPSSCILLYCIQISDVFICYNSLLLACLHK